MPAVLVLARRFEARGLRVMGVTESALTGDDRDSVTLAIREEQMTFPTLLDPEGAWSKSAAIEVDPTFLVVAKDGRVLHRVTGKLIEASETFTKIAAIIDEALGK